MKFSSHLFLTGSLAALGHCAPPTPVSEPAVASTVALEPEAASTVRITGYSSKGCGGNSVFQLESIKGQPQMPCGNHNAPGSNNGCYEWDGVTSIGLETTTGVKLTVSAFAKPGCTGTYQSIGIDMDKSIESCTNLNINGASAWSSYYFYYGCGS
ncbi:hypothetical protein NQ176_g936 [Zarea fungicola]|uniref:Uncharacterized protein n=1 Tax=Zarea fungicola TaxID=93591 RepID=A0ACC1NW24_9HYPO|nr:hypothetical protein NQ176_g936 [Lecanicillium fungicola]